MKKLLLSTAVLLSVAAAPAMAAAPQWNQLSASYTDLDASTLDEGGFGISGTKLLNSNFFVTGSYSTYTTDTVNAFGFSIDEDLNFLSLGLGVRKAVAGNTDVFGVVSYENVEAAISSGFVSQSLDDVDGYSLRAGVRSMVSPKIELKAALVHTDIEDITETGVELDAAYHFSNKFAVGVGYSSAYSVFDDAETVSLKGAINF